MTETARGRDEAEIRHLVQAQADALHEGDADRTVAWYTPDFVSFNLAPPLAVSAPESVSADGVREWLAGFDGPVSYEIRDLEVEAGGDVAFCRSLTRLSAVPRGAAEPFAMWYRQTLGLRRTAEGWRIAHEHTSTPFYMDGSLRSAVDLEP
ncbi:YybH family protein [Allonocardiopsis opalescens]|uniref:Ketosteroid isomerase-like protein n=1 Tax=Allonocardiopsis opalescens TaxID=1144618 RepID=A0A2T0PSN9_9ACTN|nr:nuclear transport factor 2 family protein [Allonocardiopsis opalescens]PRX91828.1 ketosteroid isomerase-like protein [Allonocardiopsis opalescens]